MRRLWAIPLLVGGVLAFPSPGFCEGHLFLNFGGRSIDQNFDPVQDQVALGLTLFLWQEKVRPEGFVIGIQSSQDKGFYEAGGLTFEPDLELRELSLGAAKLWDNLKRGQPFIGGGFTVIQITIRLTENPSGFSTEEEDHVFAPYINGGVLWTVGRHFTLGVDGRLVVDARTDLAAFGSANYVQLGGMAGWGW